jgi:hypothetical protein
LYAKHKLGYAVHIEPSGAVTFVTTVTVRTETNKLHSLHQGSADWVVADEDNTIVILDGVDPSHADLKRVPIVFIAAT